MNPCSAEACFLASRFGKVSVLNWRYPLKAGVPCHNIRPAPAAELVLVHQYPLEIIARRCGYVKNVKTCCAFEGHCWQGMFNMPQSGTTWGSAVQFCGKCVLVNCKLYQIKQLAVFCPPENIALGICSSSRDGILFFDTDALFLSWSSNIINI